MPLPLRPLPSLLLLALLGASAVAMAGPQDGQEPRAGRAAREAAMRERQAPPPRPQQEQRQRPQRFPDRLAAPQRHEDALSDSVRRIERSTRGQVLSAERVQYDGRNLNRIKVVDESGRVRVYMDDPQQSGPPTRGDDD